MLYLMCFCFLENLVCALPLKIGQCTGGYLRYYYSPEHHTCRTFYWTGCVGNGNRFLSFNECNATCYKAKGRCALKWAVGDFNLRSISKLHLNEHLLCDTCLNRCRSWGSFRWNRCTSRWVTESSYPQKTCFQLYHSKHW